MGVVNRTKTWVAKLANVTEEQVMMMIMMMMMITGKQDGNYTCLVKNQSGENGSKTIEMEIKGESFHQELIFFVQH